MIARLRWILLSLPLLLGLLPAKLHATPPPSALWAHLRPHPDIPIEWWYMTGFLSSEKGRHFGFQATFFRMANQSPGFSGSPSSQSPWAPREIFGFHGALSDLDNKTFLSTERERRGFSRSVLAQAPPFSVRIGRNRLDHPAPDAPFLRLVFRVGNQSYDLRLIPQSPPVWHAARRKFFTGPHPTDWAYYYSYPLVTIAGTRTVVRPDGARKTESVHGQCWFDHEWMFHTMNKDQIGWIWVWGWNKENTRGIMLYQMLDRGARLSPFHRATVLERDAGAWRVRRTNGVKLTSGKEGRCLSPGRLEFLVDNALVVRVRPMIEDQLLKGAVTYWEGASRIKIGKTPSLENGKGYLEVTGLGALSQGRLCRQRP
ncbi:MAG: carotenoid 1,2-hydratase [Nitrospirae bacterium]|nr:carotenoid 1,2-hydratase [Nitrospirota bacterium]